MTYQERYEEAWGLGPSPKGWNRMRQLCQELIDELEGLRRDYLVDLADFTRLRKRDEVAKKIQQAWYHVDSEEAINDFLCHFDGLLDALGE